MYSPADIAALQAAAGRLAGTLRAETYTTLIALLVVTGLRISEAIALDDNDIDTSEGMLIVRQDKAQASAWSRSTPRRSPRSPATSAAATSCSPPGPRPRYWSPAPAAASPTTASTRPSPARLPAAVLADLLNITPGTAVRWMHQAEADWNRYAAEIARSHNHPP